MPSPGTDDLDGPRRADAVTQSGRRAAGPRRANPCAHARRARDSATAWRGRRSESTRVVLVLGGGRGGPRVVQPGSGYQPAGHVPAGGVPHLRTCGRSCREGERGPWPREAPQRARGVPHGRARRGRASGLRAASSSSSTPMTRYAPPRPSPRPDAGGGSSRRGLDRDSRDVEVDLDVASSSSGPRAQQVPASASQQNKPLGSGAADPGRAGPARSRPRVRPSRGEPAGVERATCSAASGSSHTRVDRDVERGGSGTRTVPAAGRTPPSRCRARR